MKQDSPQITFGRLPRKENTRTGLRVVGKYKKLE